MILSSHLVKNFVCFKSTNQTDINVTSTNIGENPLNIEEKTENIYDGIIRLEKGHYVRRWIDEDGQRARDSGRAFVFSTNNRDQVLQILTQLCS